MNDVPKIPETAATPLPLPLTLDHSTPAEEASPVVGGGGGGGGSHDEADTECRRRLHILDLLDEIERTHWVRIIWACESGSRAWGFPSRDSDYDVRFLYVRPRNDYFSIDVEHRRDVIESMSDDRVYDLSGWDVRKALGLARKSNPSLVEWLGSHVIYRCHADTVALVQTAVLSVYRPETILRHYTSMARVTWKHSLQGRASVQAKRYLYAIRALLAVRWIRAFPDRYVPMDLGELADGTLTADVAVGSDDASSVRVEIDRMVAHKRDGVEWDDVPRNDLFNGFIETELRVAAETMTKDPPAPRMAGDADGINAAFRAIVTRVEEERAGE